MFHNELLRPYSHLVGWKQEALIDLCITNSQEKVSNFGVVHVGISDHSLVCMTRKANYDHNGSRTIEMRQFKNFQKDKFLNDLEQMPWRKVSSHSDPNDMWQEWKNLFVSCMDKHVPLKSKRIRNKRSPWITSELLQRMRRRDVLKKKAISSNDHAMWQQFKRARNQVNNATKLAKKRYFSENLAIYVKLGILLTSSAHGIVVSRPISWKSKLIIEL